MAKFLSLLGIVVFGVLVALLHVLEPAYTPSTSTVSEYALGHYGWIMHVAFFALALGSAILAQTLGSRRVLTKVSIAGLWLWTLGTAIAGLFTTDPGGAATSWHGILHGIAASVALLSLYVAEVGTWRRYARHHPDKLPATVTLSTAIACMAVPVIVVLGGLRALPFGLVERAIIAVHLLWLLSLAFVDMSSPVPTQRAYSDEK